MRSSGSCVQPGVDVAVQQRGPARCACARSRRTGSSACRPPGGGRAPSSGRSSRRRASRRGCGVPLVGWSRGASGRSARSCRACVASWRSSSVARSTRERPFFMEMLQMKSGDGFAPAGARPRGVWWLKRWLSRDVGDDRGRRAGFVVLPFAASAAWCGSCQSGNGTLVAGSAGAGPLKRGAWHCSKDPRRPKGYAARLVVGEAGEPDVGPVGAVLSGDEHLDLAGRAIRSDCAPSFASRRRCARA